MAKLTLYTLFTVALYPTWGVMLTILQSPWWASWEQVFKLSQVFSVASLCCNLLELSPVRIHLIDLSHKWNQILFIISNSKLGIWLCSQPRIDLNSQSNFYYVLTRPYKYLSNTLSTLSTKQHALKTIYMLVSPHYTTQTTITFFFN